MPHKNDIKFVKTARCNDRTAWPYGVGAKGVSRGRKENARASGERKGRTADTSSKRNRNREQPPEVLFLTAIDMILSVPRINSGRFECNDTRVKQCMLSSFVPDQNVIEGCRSRWWECGNIKIISGLSWGNECCLRWHLFELPAKRFRPKINCRRVGRTRFTIEIDRLAVFIVQAGRPIEDKIDWRCKLLRIFQLSVAFNRRCNGSNFIE